MFINPTQKRLRAGWRILIFFILFWTFSATVFLVKPLLGEMTRREYMEDYQFLIVLILAVSATLSVAIARPLLDKKSFYSLGFGGGSRVWKDLLFGFLLSGLMAAVFLLLGMLFGFVEITSVASLMNPERPEGGTGFANFLKVMSLGVLGLLFLEHVLVGYWEELVFRGYIFQNMEEGMGTPLAILVSCVLYGLLHATNPNAGLLSTLIIALFGFLRIYGFLLTQYLWLSMGMHIGWNFFQGPVFGFGASGHQLANVLQLKLSGPDWLSGGAFGPEGSVLIIPILLLALLAMRWWATRA